MRRRTDRLPDDGAKPQDTRAAESARPALVIDFVIGSSVARPAPVVQLELILICTMGERNSGSPPVTEARRVGS
jgi:hypothetical protein